MKTSKRARNAGLLASAAIAAAGALIIASQSEKSLETASAKSLSDARAAVSAAVYQTFRLVAAEESRGRAGRQSHRAAAKSPGAPERERRGSRAIDDAFIETLPEFVQEVVRADEALATVAYFRQHVLLSPELREEYHELLSDPEMFEKVRQDVLYPGEARETLAGNTKRLMAIDYLRDALAWDENPEREALLAMIEDMILEDNFLDELGMDMRISLATAKMELFTLLYEHAPDAAQTLVEAARGGKLERMIAYFAAAVPARAARERALAITP